MKKTFVAVATVAALGAATIPVARARDNAGPIIAGALIGAVVGVMLSQQRAVYASTPAMYPPPPRMVYAPPPQVVYAPSPVAVRRAPVVVYHRHHGWREHEWRRHDRRWPDRH